MPTGRLPQNNRNYNIKMLQDRHKEIIRQSVLGVGREEIALSLGVTPATITNTCNSELGKAQREMLQIGRDTAVTEIDEKIQAMLPMAIAVMGGALEGRIEQVEGSNISPSQQMKAAQDILGRGGHVPPTRVQDNRKDDNKFSVDDIIELKKRAASLDVNGYIGDIEEAVIVESKSLEETNAEDSSTEGHSSSDIPSDVS